MLTINNGKVAVYVKEDATEVIISDLLRDQAWKLDQDTALWGEEISYNNRPKDNWKENIHLLKPEYAEIENDGSIRVVYAAGTQKVNMIYTLLEDGVEITLSPVGGEVKSVALPGAFEPIGKEKEIIMPIMQGVVWKGAGEPVDRMMISGSHDNFSLQMFGMLSDKGGFLYAPDSIADCFWRYAKEENGKYFAESFQISSLGEMRYERKTKIFVVERSIKAVAKRYRKLVIARDRFITWDEKIEKRPALERLFGSIMCFIGYCQDDIQYAKEFRKLRDYGFDRALIYPVRMHSYSLGFKMGGKDPIWLSDDEMEEIKALGYDIAPWSWINEAMNDGTKETENLYRINKDGKHILGWRIDDFIWDKCCSTKMAEFQAEADKHGMSQMTWDHFDVLTCAMIGECYAKDHKHHLNRLLSRTEDIEWLKKTLEYGMDGRKPVSSESFNDIFSKEYDMGSVKAFPLNWKRPFTVIPLTSLVYHDSILHTWWEPHNYNTHYFNRTFAAGYMEYGGGKTRLMAANDALMGAIPDVFPFGSMYGWTGRGNETFLYKIRFEDPDVQFALREAKPVADLHRRIGKLEMTDFEILSDDGCVQRSVFKDGTSVIANFSNFLRCDSNDMQPLGAESWMIDERM